MQQSLTNNTLGPGDITGLEALMKSAVNAGLAANAEPLTRLAHSFAPGLYARQLWRPKGTLIVGKTHRTGCMNFLMTGHLTVWSNGETRDYIAPAVWASTGGAKRVTFAREDSLLVTVHATNETDLDKLEAELIVPELEMLA